MLERIEQIQGVGLLHNTNGKPFALQKSTLIYADNGRGKSTFAGVLRSLATGDASIVSSRTTVDAGVAPNIVLQLGSGHKVKFENGVWSERRAEFLVFDADFIERNVHSGGIVDTNHRKNLLEFALGESAVTARKCEEDATRSAKGAGDRVRQIEAQLSGHHQGVSLQAFKDLSQFPDADEQIEALQKRVNAANGIALIVKKPIPANIQIPSLDFEALFAIFRTSIEDVQEDAEKIVRRHLLTFPSSGGENWLSQGLVFTGEENCPYCGQEITGLELIRAYRTHFNAEYKRLKDNVARLSQGVQVRTNLSIVDDFERGVAEANARSAAWEEQVMVESATFDVELAKTIVRDLQVLLSELVEKKQLNPIVQVGDDSEKARAQKLWQTLIDLMNAANYQVTAAKAKIEGFKIKLSVEKVEDLQRQIQKLELSKRRHTKEVDDLFDILIKARNEVRKADGLKKSARDSLNELMLQTLSQYKNSINKLLLKFGASFSIEKMDANFRGGSPRSEYGLSLRGRSVLLEGAALSFTNALSDGDKRTLAFAFFVASTLANTSLNQRIVVVDDPMCSLDLNRKQHTKAVLKQIGEKAEQLIVLAHDPYFIRGVRDVIADKDSVNQVCVLQLKYAQKGYSDIEKFDVDKACESPYFKHHRILRDFVENGAGDPTHNAKVIRLVLEGYLHRRFPSLIPRNLMFGQVVGIINDSTSEPISLAKGIVDELREINDYAGKFHHDTDQGNGESVVSSVTELQSYARRALDLIYRGV